MVLYSFIITLIAEYFLLIICFVIIQSVQVSLSIPEGLLKFGFGRDVPQRNLKVDPYKYQFFKKKWPIHIPIGPIWAKSPKFSIIFLNLSQFWLKFGKILKNQLIHVPNFAFYMDHSYTKRLILLPMMAAHPYRVFCTEYPLPVSFLGYHGSFLIFPLSLFVPFCLRFWF